MTGIVGLEDGRRPRAKDAHSFRSWRGEKANSPRAFWKDGGPADTFLSACGGPFRASDPRSSKEINVRCFKPRHAW